MKIEKTEIPSGSEFASKKFDYFDSYQSVYHDPLNKITSTDIGKAFFSSAPAWSAKLFEFRNRVVKIFGLKTPDDFQNRDEALANFKCEPNERLGLFTVYDKTENEVILGEDDRHLNFRVSLFKEEGVEPEFKKLTITTVVEFNNAFGKLYFLPVKPFHKLIVPKMLKGTIKAIEERNK